MTTGNVAERPHSEIAHALDLEVIRYSQVWEDHCLLEKALQITEDDHILSIGSAGCNVLALLLQRPHRVTAVDMSPAQTALMELKFAGIKLLEYAEFLSLWGLRTDHDRGVLYARLAPQLSAAARAYWQQHQAVLAHGVIHAGKLDGFFRTMQQQHLAPLWSPQDIQQLLSAASLAEQRQQLQRLQTDAFVRMFLAYFSASSLASHGRDPAQFRYVTAEKVAEYVLERFRYACTQMPLPGNHYMEYFLTGTYRDLTTGPLFLRPGPFQTLKGLLDRVTIVRTELETYLASVPPGTFSKANLSDIFEYMSAAASASVFTLLAHAIRPGGRIAYWNLFVPRQSPPALAHAWQPLTALAQQLWQHDRAWFYQQFHVEERRAAA